MHTAKLVPRALRTSWQMFKALWGCPRGWYLHHYEWGFGPDAVILDNGEVVDFGTGGWWLYCSKCEEIYLR